MRNMKKLTIGTVELDNPLVLAPMAGVTDLPFRLLCKEMGAGLVCMEMISAKALYYKNKNTRDMLHIDPRERPVSLQLFGSDPDCIAEMAKEIEELPFAVLDINMGCPVPKVFGNGDGSALMKDPKLVAQIVEKTAKAIKKPVTVKMRTGVDDQHINAPEIAHICEECGAAAVAVHGRTREQYYSGQADWNVIAEVKRRVKIPVIGNGDIKSAKDVLEMKRITNCDGFMIGRGAEGNPWIFRQILHALETGEELPKPSIEEMCDVVLRHARMVVEEKGEDRGIREMRKHAAWYTAGYRNSSRFRGLMNEAKTYEDLEQLFLRMKEG
ncbi:MAG: tRNA dihydrouridine synthase DusB [Lachnospiraceae bacterium]|nr:tRNA dihydrouridine synthase DusB [Lachnospiraceae bacterium]